MNEYTQPRSDEERRAREGRLCNMGTLLRVFIRADLSRDVQKSSGLFGVVCARRRLKWWKSACWHGEEIA